MPSNYQAYVDGSGTGDPNLFVIAGYIATARDWESFSKEWRVRLQQARLTRFKMSEMARSKIDVAGYFYRAIEDSKIKAAISCAIDTAGLRKAVDEFVWPANLTNVEALTNPYYFAFKAITDLVAQYQHELGIEGPVDFVFDDEAEKSRLAGMWDRLKLSSSPEFRKNMGADPVFGRDEDLPPLQAADLYAWWVRKWCVGNIPNWGESLPFPWTMKRNIRRLHADFSEKDFIIEFQRGLRPEAVARWNITDPAALLRHLEERERGIRMTLPNPSSPVRFAPWQPRS
jgi:uncharacterized protein DUF3800